MTKYIRFNMTKSLARLSDDLGKLIGYCGEIKNEDLKLKIISELLISNNSVKKIAKIILEEIDWENKTQSEIKNLLEGEE